MKIRNTACFLEDHACSRPFQRAVVFPEGRAAHGRVTYSQLNFQQLDALASTLATGFLELGIKRGDRVSLFVRPSLEFVGMVFAVFKIGAVPVLIDPGMGLKAVLKCLETIKPDALIAEPVVQAMRPIFPKAFSSVQHRVTAGGSTWYWGGVTLDQCKRSGGAAFRAVDVAPDEDAAILFTSGSTGPAKGVTYTHRIFNAQTQHIQEMYGIQPGEIDLPCFPLFGLFSVAMGVTIVVPDMDPTKPAEADPALLVEAILDQGCTAIFGSPALLRPLAAFCVKHEIQLPKVCRVLSAGAPIPPDLHEAFSKILSAGAEIHTPYGATEALPVATIGSSAVLQETAAATRSGRGTCVGRLAPNIELAIIPIEDAPIEDWATVQQLPAGAIGEICVKGPVVTREYKAEPEHTRASKIQDGAGWWHRMGDVGYLDSEGRLWFCGRKAHRVECSDGTVLFPVRCEGVFNAHQDVYRTALVAIDGQPVLIVELRQGLTRRAELCDELRELGAEYEETAPIKTFLYHPSFPVDARHNAKIDRPALALWGAGKV